ncbi:MAG: hypothetical protein A2020_11810 [Lentisphaerae bacterium GWF2_45_14]|nr:MAG: hypothetical protein A2020_11810 [Lentisphaerae bacterium GWF2_45_14]
MKLLSITPFSITVIIFFSFAAMIFADETGATSDLRVVPAPKYMEVKDEFFELPTDITVTSSDIDCANYLKDQLSDILNSQLNITVRASDNKDFSLVLAPAGKDFSRMPACPARPQAYSLETGDASVRIKAFDLAGLRFGIQTFLQIAEQTHGGKYPVLTVKDFPGLKERWFLIILRPGKFMEMDSKEKTLDFYYWVFKRLARYKYNYVCLDFSPYTELRCHPEFRPEPFFNYEDIKRLIQKGKYHGLKLIPDFESFGKFMLGQSKETLEKNADILERKNDIGQGLWKEKFNSNQKKKLAEQKRPELGEGELSEGLNILNPKVPAMIMECIDETYILFDKPEYFFVGGDEHWDFCTSLSKDIDKGELFAGYFNNLNRHLQEKNCRTIIWGDMLLSHLQFPYFYENHGGPPMNTHTAIKYLDKNIIIGDWHYGWPVSGSPPKFYPSISWFRQNGFDVIATTWFRNDNIYNVSRDAAALDCLGIMGTAFSLHNTFKVNTGIWKKNHEKFDMITKRRELGVFAATAEGGWNPVESEKILQEYDTVEWEKRWLPQKLMKK